MLQECDVDAVRCSRTEQLRLVATHKGSLSVLRVIGSQRMGLPHVRIGLTPALSLTDDRYDAGGLTQSDASHMDAVRESGLWGPLPTEHTHDTPCRRRALGLVSGAC